jgi:hypothetical protein
LHIDAVDWLDWCTHVAALVRPWLNGGAEAGVSSIRALRSRPKCFASKAGNIKALKVSRESNMILKETSVSFKRSELVFGM